MRDISRCQHERHYIRRHSDRSESCGRCGAQRFANGTNGAKSFGAMRWVATNAGHDAICLDHEMIAAGAVPDGPDDDSDAKNVYPIKTST